MAVAPCLPCVGPASAGVARPPPVGRAPGRPGAADRPGDAGALPLIVHNGEHGARGRGVGCGEPAGAAQGACSNPMDAGGPGHCRGRHAPAAASVSPMRDTQQAAAVVPRGLPGRATLHGHPVTAIRQWTGPASAAIPASPSPRAHVPALDRATGCRAHAGGASPRPPPGVPGRRDPCRPPGPPATGCRRPARRIRVRATATAGELFDCLSRVCR